MATLNGENSLSVEIRYHDFPGEDYDWIQYLFYFRHNDKSVVRESDLKQDIKWHDWHEDRPSHAIWIEDHREDCILPLVRMALNTNVAVYLEMLEEDLTLSIFPSKYHPRLHISTENYCCSRESALKLAAEIQANYDRFIPSYFDFIFEFHTRIFADDSPFASNGLLFRITAKRQEIERFCGELTAEYHEFNRKFNLDSAFKTYKDWKPMV
jgi:hypothetical protein